jgi:uncharacterized protein (TIGR02001 family)
MRGQICRTWTLATFAGIIVLAGQAQADQAAKIEWSATVGATSDYVFRGLSYNDERPAAQASIDMAYGILSAGVWGSNVTGDGYEPGEVDIYANLKPVWREVTFDLGVIWYTYPGARPGGLGYDSVELKAGMEYSPAAKVTLTPVFWYVPEQQNAPATYTYESAISYELPALGQFTPTISGLFGYTHADEADAFSTGVDDYAYWNAGVQLAVEKFTFDFRYWDTDISRDGLADERFVFSTGLALP